MASAIVDPRLSGIEKYSKSTFRWLQLIDVGQSNILDGWINKLRKKNVDDKDSWKWHLWSSRILNAFTNFVFITLSAASENSLCLHREKTGNKECEKSMVLDFREFRNLYEFSKHTRNLSWLSGNPKIRWIHEMKFRKFHKSDILHASIVNMTFWESRNIDIIQTCIENYPYIPRNIACVQSWKSGNPR